MSKIFVETSVFIRFLTKDDPQKYQDCVKLFELVADGKLRLYTSNIVVMEILFILLRHYKFPKTKVLSAISRLLQLRNLTLIEKTDTQKALELFKKHKSKYGDCLIATQVPSGINLLTYDADFSQLEFLKVATPEQLPSRTLYLKEAQGN